MDKRLLTAGVMVCASIGASASEPSDLEMERVEDIRMLISSAPGHLELDEAQRNLLLQILQNAQLRPRMRDSVDCEIFE